MTDTKIKIIAIFEMMGRPEEHLAKAMQDLIETISKEKGVTIASKKINEPKKVEQKDKDGKIIEHKDGPLFTTFAEVELELNHVRDLIAISFKYMPANIEIINPTSFSLTNSDLSILINEVLARMHYYDAVAKSAIIQNQMLTNKLREVITRERKNSKDKEIKDKK